MLVSAILERQIFCRHDIVICNAGDHWPGASNWWLASQVNLNFDYYKLISVQRQLSRKSSIWPHFDCSCWVLLYYQIKKGLHIPCNPLILLDEPNTPMKFHAMYNDWRMSPFCLSGWPPTPWTVAGDSYNTPPCSENYVALSLWSQKKSLYFHIFIRYS